MDAFDFIIIGAGSAGCVLANRISADPENRVLLVEAGGSDNNLLVQMPTALSYPMAMQRFNWGYESDPEPELNGRVINCPRGKGLGGTSSINGMVYVRGNPHDYEEWAALGASGWGYRDCLPYFKRAETWIEGGDKYRGADGPLGVCAGNEMRLNPLYRAFIDAGVQAGYPETTDYNGAQQEGFGPMHMTVRGGVRESTTRAYLQPVKRRDNLTVITETLVQGIEFIDKRATGITVLRDGKTSKLRARREVIVAAGAIASPMLLQLSGLGSEHHLQSIGIALKHELPSIGENLQDHIEVYFQFHCKQPVSLNNKLGLISKALIGGRWLLFKNGLGSTNHFEACAFIRSRAGLKAPDIQYHFLPAAMRYDGTPSVKGHGFQVHVGPNKPKSRGRVRIKTADATSAPSILFNYYQHEEDKAAWRQCIRLTREIIDQAAMDPYRGAEIQPGINVQSDDAIDAWVRENAESAYHPAGTCKMGSADDPLAVVDEQGRVHGLQHLRVVDASIFPTLPNGNINAAVIMVAEKISDAILGKVPLPSADVPLTVPRNWQTSQR
ncbi:MAG: choline dehydrogenase [Pseudomonadales bacterium]|jgi:choline dehydrogenase|nr:choline dehydrogenase [Pseudomonadales bacterium]